MTTPYGPGNPQPVEQLVGILGEGWRGPGPVEEYLDSDSLLEVMVNAILKWREQETGERFFDGKASELAVFIINAMQDDRGVPDDRPPHADSTDDHT